MTGETNRMPFDLAEGADLIVTLGGASVGDLDLVRATALAEGLFYLQGTVFREEDIGKELALLSCEEGFWILGFVGGGGA